jgi:hypothetical protein
MVDKRDPNNNCKNCAFAYISETGAELCNCNRFSLPKIRRAECYSWKKAKTAIVDLRGGK